MSHWWQENHRGLSDTGARASRPCWKSRNAEHGAGSSSRPCPRAAPAPSCPDSSVPRAAPHGAPGPGLQAQNTPRGHQRVPTTGATLRAGSLRRMRGARVGLPGLRAVRLRCSWSPGPGLSAHAPDSDSGPGAAAGRLLPGEGVARSLGAAGRPRANAGTGVSGEPWLLGSQPRLLLGGGDEPESGGLGSPGTGPTSRSLAPPPLGLSFLRMAEWLQQLQRSFSDFPAEVQRRLQAFPQQMALDWAYVVPPPEFPHDRQALREERSPLCPHGEGAIHFATTWDPLTRMMALGCLTEHPD
ncbi:Hypothetical predicted protein [Marmota monax]|uniref:Uncharacterized protein n=1 Tax=Marmota monax TaxID=9995 RepID=A0A5E4D6R6_MARMO|nr:Hypothetical predicted protein [Marmota monax]